MTLLRKPPELKAITKRRGPYTVLSKAWLVLLYSLVIDPALAPYITHRVPDEMASQVASICALCIVPFLNQGALHRYLSRLRGREKQKLLETSGVVGLFVVLSVAVPVIMKLLLLPRLDNIVTLVGLAIVGYAALTSIRKGLRQSRDDRERLAQIPWAQVERWENHLITIGLIPLIAARSISLCGLLGEASEHQPLLSLGYSTLSALFLLLVRPSKDFFMGFCKKCKQPVPAAFVEYGSCPRCDPSLSSQIN